MHRMPWEGNLIMVWELYINWDARWGTARARGKNVPIDRRSLCEYLGVENANPRRLQKFVWSPIYAKIIHTLCFIDFNAKWTRKQGDIHLSIYFALISTRLPKYGRILYKPNSCKWSTTVIALELKCESYYFLWLANPLIWVKLCSVR